MSPGGNTGSGNNNNTFTYVDSQLNTYSRVVDAVFNKVVYDQQSGSLAPSSCSTTQDGPYLFSLPPVKLPGGKTLGGLQWL